MRLPDEVWDQVASGNHDITRLAQQHDTNWPPLRSFRTRLDIVAGKPNESALQALEEPATVGVLL